MLRTQQIKIKKGHKMYPYFDDISFKAKNLYNVGNFYLRQCLTGLKKDAEDLTPQVVGSSYIKSYVNEELRQDSNTRNMIINIEEIIEELSAAMTLEPGDIISTGTPDGVGMGYNPLNF